MDFFLTPKQKYLLDFIVNYSNERGYAPSLREMAEYIDKSLSTAQYLVKELQSRNYLTKENYRARGILPVSPSSKSPMGPITDFTDKIIEGDCLEVMQEIPDRSVDMILCDLPYGTTQNKWDSLIPLEKLWSLYERIIKDGGVIALTSQGPFTARLILSNEKLFKYKIVWQKSKPTNFLNAKKQPLRAHEDICIFYKSQPTYHPQMQNGSPYNKGIRKNQLTGSYGDFKPVEVKSDGERYPTDVIYFKTAESEGPIYHPTQKPVELAKYLIKTYTNIGDVVLDNTCGSGSFLVAAALLNRRYIGIEINRDTLLHKKYAINYIEICEKRIREALLNGTQFKSPRNPFLPLPSPISLVPDPQLGLGFSTNEPNENIGLGAV